MISVQTKAEKKPDENLGSEFNKQIGPQELGNITRFLTTSLVLPELNKITIPTIGSVLTTPKSE